MADQISLSKQLFLSDDEVTTVQTAIAACAGTPCMFEDIVNCTLKNRLTWSSSQNFLAGFVLGRLLQDEIHKEENILHRKPPHAK